MSGVMMSVTSALTMAAECAADDDADGQINDVAAQDELTKLFGCTHVKMPLSVDD